MSLLQRNIFLQAALTTTDLNKISTPISFDLMWDYKLNTTLILHTKQTQGKKKKTHLGKMASQEDLVLFGSYCHKGEHLRLRMEGLSAPQDVALTKRKYYF